MPEVLRIVVPTDFSDASLTALDWVKTYTQNKPAEIHCVTVVQIPTTYIPTIAGGSMDLLPDMDEITKLTAKNLAETMDRHKNQFNQPPVTKVLIGRPADEITRYAKDINATMIVIAARGHSQLAHILLGDTAAGVVRQAECPVVTVKG